MLKDGKFHTNPVVLNGNLESFYDNYISMYPIQKKVVENYIDYFYDWMRIITDNNIDKKTITIMKKNIYLGNDIFWFNFIKKLFDNEKFKETLLMIKFVKKEHINKTNILFNRLYFYELISLKKDLNYFNDEKIFKKICKISKKVMFSDYEKIITFFECALMYDNQEKFKKLLSKYKNNIFNWSILNILFLFELAVYTKNNILIEQVEAILLYKDISAYKEYNEKDTYMFMQAIHNENIKDVDYYKKILKNESTFDFSHYEWFAMK
jgi:hypothetical protein